MDDFNVEEQKQVDDNVMQNHLILITWFFVCVIVTSTFLVMIGVI